MSDKAYDRRLYAAQRFASARDRISRFANTCESEKQLALAQRLEVIADELEASLPSTYDGYDLETKVEVLVNATWYPGRVAKHLTPEVFGRLSIGVKLDQPPRGYEEGGLFFRHVDSAELRRVA